MSNWLSSALQTVRDRSLDAFDFVKRDLTEFTTTVKSDTETYINKIKTQEVGDLGINRFVSKFSNSTNTDEKHFQASSSFDRVHTEMTRLQNDESTYLIDPIPIESYEHWRQTTNFNVENLKGEIAQLLINAPHVRSFYAHLVPAQTTHSDFWSRYYYRLQQIENDETKRLELLKRAKEICSKNSQNNWEESDEEETIKIDQTTTIPITITSTVEKSIENNNISGDIWEGQLEEKDNVTSSTTSIDPEPKLEEEEEEEEEEAVTSEKKTDIEFDDEWESWS